MTRAGECLAGSDSADDGDGAGSYEGEIHQFAEHVSAYMSSHALLRGVMEEMAAAISGGGGLACAGRLLMSPDDLVRPADRPHLSQREVEVLREASHDLSQQEIAERLCISTRTVSTHLQNIYQKLGVRTPMRAVASAVTLGYLQVEEIGFLESILATPSTCLLASVPLLPKALEASHAAGGLRPLAMSGLLLMMLGGAAARRLRRVEEDDEGGSTSHLCELDEDGQVLRRFGQRSLESFLGMAVAPRHAEREGFAPGHVFVISSAAAGPGPETVVVEFTPEGRRVREFGAAVALESRPQGGMIAFGPRGRLLLASGGDAIVAFSRGGTVRDTLANGRFDQVCAGPRGLLYAVETSCRGSAVRVFDGSGRFLHSLGGASPLGAYRGLAVNGRGAVFTVRHEQGACRLEERDPDGGLQSSVLLPGPDAGCPAVGPNGMVYVPHPESGHISVVSSGRGLVRRIRLGGELYPHGLAIGDANRLWACGRQARM